MRVIPLSLALSLLPLTQCATSNTKTLDVSSLDSDEGYVVTRLVSPDMRNDPNAIFGTGFRLHYRPVDSGLVKSMFSSTRAGDFIDVESAEGPKLVALKLKGGRYVFHSVVVSLQETDFNVEFDALPGKVTYIGDVELAVGVGMSQTNLPRVGRSTARVLWRPEEMAALLEKQYPSNPPELVDRRAVVR